jgi:hypothetical protein
MVLSPVGFGTRNQCNGESQQQFSSRLAQPLLVPGPTELVTVFQCLKFESPPNLESQVTVFLFLRNRISQLCPEALGSLFVASLDSTGCSGGIRSA